MSIGVGDPALGETTKTGPRMGVRPDRPGIEKFALRYKEIAEKAGQASSFVRRPGTVLYSLEKSMR